MAGTTIQQETRYNGTHKSALQIIFGRTFGNTLVQVALVLICVLWSVPTLGLFISSFRTADDISSTGWWTFIQGPGESPRGGSISIVPPDADGAANTRSMVIAGESIRFEGDTSRLLRDAPGGIPGATIASFGVTSIRGELEITAFDEPFRVPYAGTIAVSEDGTFEYQRAAGFEGVFDPSVTVPEDGELPFTITYSLEGLDLIQEPFEVDLIERSIRVPAYNEPVQIGDIGQIVVSGIDEYEFTPDEDYAYGEYFELIFPEEAEEPPFELRYRIAPFGERLNLVVAFAFVESDGTITAEPRGATTSISVSTDADVTQFPFTLQYEAERRGGRIVTVDAGTPIVIPEVGELLIEGDGSLSFEADPDFVGEIAYRHDIRNPFVTMDNYEFVVTEDRMDTAFFNSLTVVIPATIIPIALAAFAAYAFSWMDFPGRRVLFVIVVGLMVVPLQVAFIPLLQAYRPLGLNESFLGLWLAHTGFGMPLAVFLLRNYIAGLPRELIESASIDGASHFTIFMRLVLPLSVPALAAFAIFQFLWVWNDLLVALVFLGNRPVVTSRLSEMVGSRGQDWHVLTSGAFITMIIPLIVFFSLQRYFVRGLLAGSVKGG